MSVAEEALKVVEMLRKSGRSTFRHLIGDSDSTLVVVARFLALLELYREGVLRFEQVMALGELHITWTGTLEGVVAVSDEFDLPVSLLEENEGTEGNSTEVEIEDNTEEVPNV